MIKKRLRTISLTTLMAVMCTFATAQTTGTRQNAAVTAPPAPVASAGVRVTCEGKNADAQIFVNGVFKGNCPIDITVPEGLIEVKAIKALDAVYDNLYLARFRLGADATRRVEVNFRGKSQFGATAIARADAAIDAESTRKEAQQVLALPELERAAQGGDAAAMTRLGVIYERGLAGPVDFKKAVTWYGRAAQAGDAAGMSAYARFLRLGSGVPEDAAQAAALFARAAAKGDPEGLLQMGWLLISGGPGVEKNPKQALALLKTAAERGHPEAYRAQAVAQMTMGEPTSAEMDEENEAKEALANIKRAEGGEDYAAMAKATRYFGQGQHVARNPELALKYARTAMRYYKKAAASGEDWTINVLALEYQYGSITPSDSIMAERLFRKAASMGSKVAEKHLAEMLK